MTRLLGLLAAEIPLFALLLLGYRRENEAAVVNTVAAILATASPAGVELVLHALGTPGASFTPLLTLWIGVASVLHSLGMLGYYESVDWWDHLTHSVSAGLAAALLYAALLVGVGPASDGGTLALVGTTLAVILLLSLVWELAELGMRHVGDWYGVEPVLVTYGWRDTAYDLVYDLLGAVLVLAFDLRLFVSVFETLAAAL